MPFPSPNVYHNEVSSQRLLLPLERFPLRETISEFRYEFSRCPVRPKYGLSSSLSPALEYGSAIFDCLYSTTVLQGIKYT